MMRHNSNYLQKLAEKREEHTTGWSTQQEFEFTVATGITAAISVQLKEAMGEQTKKIKNTARQILTSNGNIRTGLLRKAIDAKVTEKKQNLKIDKNGEVHYDYRVWGGVGINRAVKGVDEYGNTVWPVRYSHLIEFGHASRNGVKTPAKPFMRKSLMQVGEVERAVANAVLKAIKDSGKNG